MEEERKLVSIVFTDIKGYTAMMENDEALALKTVASFEKFTRETCSKYNGKVVNFMGDGALLVFVNSTDALEFALDIQTRFILEENIQHRIGINTGEVVFKDGNVYGDSVNVAARIESLGIPGGILISDSTYQLIKNKKKFEVKSMGEFHFKNKKDLMEVFAVINEPLAIPQRKDLKGKTEPKKFPKWLMFSSIGAFVFLLFIAFYFGNQAFSSVPKTWDGIWEINTISEDNNLITGEMEMEMVNNKWTGSASIMYGQSSDVSIELLLNNITEQKDKNTLTGNWTSDFLTSDSLKGMFELTMDPSFKEFQGDFMPSDGSKSFQLKGIRK